MTLETCGRYKVSMVVTSHGMASGVRVADRIAVVPGLTGGGA